MSDENDSHIFGGDFFTNMKDVLLEVLHLVDVIVDASRCGWIEAMKLNFLGNPLHGSDTKVHRIQENPDGMGKDELLDMLKYYGLVVEEDEGVDPGIKHFF